MGKKGQKYRKDYDDELIEKVINEYQNNEGTYVSLAKKYNIASWHTVENWIRKYREKGQISRQKRGRVKGTKMDYKERYEILKKFQAFLEEQHEKK